MSTMHYRLLTYGATPAVESMEGNVDVAALVTLLNQRGVRVVAAFLGAGGENVLLVAEVGDDLAADLQVALPPRLQLLAQVRNTLHPLQVPAQETPLARPHP